MTETIEPDQLAARTEAPLMTRKIATVRLADGRLLRTEVGNPDTIRWEKTAARRWPELLPDVKDGEVRFKAPMFMQTFVAWASLKRTRQYDGEFEQFADTDCLEVTTDEEPVDPTPPGHSPG